MISSVALSVPVRAGERTISKCAGGVVVAHVALTADKLKWTDW